MLFWVFFIFETLAYLFFKNREFLRGKAIAVFFSGHWVIFLFESLAYLFQMTRVFSPFVVGCFSFLKPWHIYFYFVGYFSFLKPWHIYFNRNARVK
jgi:hypothetical protein